jgi:predicted secreted Zn-dependent protease
MTITELPRTAWRKSSYSGNGGGSCVEVALAWRKSSRSGNGGGDCVEVAAAQTLHLARDSKNPDGPVLAFTRPEWSTFLTAVKAGDHDL